MGMSVSGIRRHPVQRSARLNGHSTSREDDLSQKTITSPASASSQKRLSSEISPKPAAHASPGVALAPQLDAKVQDEPRGASDPPFPVAPQFVPRFRGAAEMDARRKLRILARQGAITAAHVPVSTEPSLNPELSSTEEEESPSADDEDEFDDGADGDDSMDMDGDEFDPYARMLIFWVFDS